MLAVLLGATLGAGCRDEVDRDKLAKATALAGAPLPSGAGPAAPADPGCPTGSEIMGAPRPRGSGQWCQRVEGERVTIYRLDGTKWAEGAVRGSLAGAWTFYAPDGKVALVRNFDDDTGNRDDVKLEGVELPPTLAPVCMRGWTGKEPATTTKCAPP